MGPLIGRSRPLQLGSSEGPKGAAEAAQERRYAVSSSKASGGAKVAE